MFCAIIVRACMVSQMLTAVHMSTAAFQDCVGSLLTSFGGATFVHLSVLLYSRMWDNVSVLYNR